MGKESLRRLIGENIRNERMSRKMSIDELAEVLGLTPGFVGLIERGRRGATAYTLYRIAQAFNITVDDIFSPLGSGLLSVSDDKQKENEIMNKKVSSLIVSLTTKELQFVITLIKAIKAMNNNATEYIE
jgi:transcriptional regulator with XRE-family HTH domain